jgi:hypothetical protein
MTKWQSVQQSEAQRDLRGDSLRRKPDRKPFFVDRMALWLSTSRMVDGLWVGTTEGKPRPGLRRVEDALRLIKDHDLLRYFRVIHHLERIWIHLLPSALAHYDRTLNACVFDERFLETMTLERIASTIVHEATHARLERWGVSYEEKARSRIEAICLRRELNFLTKLPDSETLQEEIVRTLEWLASGNDYLSDVSFREREVQGQVETLHYLRAPRWLIRLALRIIRRRRLRAVMRSGS